MSIYRVKKERNFTMISNEVVNDTSISFKAKGIMLYLLSKPDNWAVYEKDIISHSTDGRDSVRNGIKELINAGYISRHRVRNQNGQLGNCEYEVRETHEKPTCDGKTNVGFPYIGKPPTNNTDLSNTDLSKTENFRHLSRGKTEQLLNDDAKRFFEYFADKYFSLTGKDHPSLNMDAVEKLNDLIESGQIFDSDYDREFFVDVDQLYKMVDEY